MTNSIPMHTIAPASRLHYMDNGRALLRLTVLMIHSALAYTTSGFFSWATQDLSGSRWMNLLVFLMHSFAMPCFFLISGFFARYLWRTKKTPHSFWKNRLARIALPFFALLLLYIPFKFIVFMHDLYIQYTTIHHPWPPFVTIIKQSQALGPLLSRLLAPNELWFLWYLLFFYWLTYPLSLLEKYVDLNWPFFLIFTVLIPLAVAYWWPDTRLIEPNSLILAPQYVIYFACYFIVGWFTEKTPLFFEHLANAIYPCLGFLLLGIPALYVSTISFEYKLNGLNPSLAFPILHTLIAVSEMGLFFGVLYRYGDKPNGLLRYLADCSYWCYLTELPVVLTIQSLLAPLSWPILVKFFMVVGSTQIFCCATYECFVRHTVLRNFVGNAKPARPAYTHTQQNPLSSSLV